MSRRHNDVTFRPHGLSTHKPPHHLLRRGVGDGLPCLQVTTRSLDRRGYRENRCNVGYLFVVTD